MKFKYFDQFEIKSDEDNGRTIVGYGSVFGNVDLGDDVVVKGAFAKSLTERMPKMLWNHDKKEAPIGVWTKMEEDDHGLRVEGELADTPRGNEVAELIRIGAISGLSIGYNIKQGAYDQFSKAYQIKEAELWEVSCVNFPMNEEAVIDSIKAAAMTKREVEEKLRDAGFSKSVAMALISGGFEALQSKAQRDADPEEQAMQEFIEAVKARAAILKIA